ncbi:MAG: 1-aminocyclopropane-1-carboxylate deaminase/D-cysteine desulfhydrase [Methylococcales bacterium]|nr:1-aminocyclopropane-1-carboxylate deaminase/D-cysteine desulfhydrase [Methylococcales bacterium]
MHSKLIELEKQFKPSILTQLHSPLLTQKNIELWVKRDDLIHPIISGNKWRKLKYIVNDALNNNFHSIISMGGAYSNHLHALALVGKQLNLKTIAYIRGEQPKKLSATIQDIQSWGMELRFVSRTDYRILRNYKKPDQLPGIKSGEYWLPEGGATELALQGVAELVSEIDMDFDTLCIPCGTGTTLAGLLTSNLVKTKVYGFSALKGADFLFKDVANLLNQQHIQNNWNIYLQYHFGGFAKTNNELSLYIETFKKQYDIALDSVYTGKMFYGLFDLIKQDAFNSGEKIVAIHTGGLQGNRVY